MKFWKREPKKPEHPSITELDGVVVYSGGPDGEVDICHCQEGFVEFEMTPSGRIKAVRTMTEDELLREFERMRNQEKGLNA